MRLMLGLNRHFRAIKKRRRVDRALSELAGRVQQDQDWPSRCHCLSRRLVVSITSFPKRFNTLLPTLQSLLFQTVRPDAVQLWIAHSDVVHLPKCVKDLQEIGLEVRTCDDTRSYKKIIPALTENPESLIVTADDDVYYWPSWLEELVTAYQRTGNTVIAHRAHRIVLRPDGLPDAYAKWEHPLTHPLSSSLVFPVGVHGVFYDPMALHPDVTRKDLFMSLCPNTDDVWLYWMHRRLGSRPLTLALGQRILEWPDSQNVQLQSENLRGGGNDRSITAMIAKFGFPEIDMDTRDTV